MRAPHPVFLAATRLDGLGQALLAGQSVAVSGLALSEIAAVMYAAATEIRELQTQARDAAQAQADTAEGVMAAVKAANRRGGHEPKDVPTEEYDARLDVIDTGRAYASALMQLDRLHEQRAAFHAAQARLDAALARAQAGASSEGQGEGA